MGKFLGFYGQELGPNFLAKPPFIYNNQSSIDDNQYYWSSG